MSFFFFGTCFLSYHNCVHDSITYLCSIIITFTYVSGHPIADVRTRALHSLMFKLSNQIIQPYDLANNKSFLKSLLEWFNNDHWECETIVIHLIERLSYVCVAK